MVYIPHRTHRFLSLRILSSPGLAALYPPDTFLSLSAGMTNDKKKEKKNKHTDSSYTTDCLTAREENILRCLISTVGKAILTKPINPWASDGTDLILSAAAVRPPLCVLLLCSDTLHSDDDARLYFAPPRNTNSHSDAACSSLRSTVERERERETNSHRLRGSSATDEIGVSAHSGAAASPSDSILNSGFLPWSFPTAPSQANYFGHSNFTDKTKQYFKSTFRSILNR